MLLTSICVILPVLSNAQIDFSDLVYDEFGYTDNNTSILSSSNITNIVHRILNGKHYDEPAEPSTCQGANCSETCYSPIISSSVTQKDDFLTVCPQILFSLTQDCIKSETPRQNRKHNEEKSGTKPGTLQVWGYGFLFVTLINLCSLAGIFVLPLMKTEFYSTLLMFLIALAVGSLAANGILVLIPEAFEIIERDGYMWRACSIIGGIYLFFVTERCLKMITDHYVKKRNEQPNRESDKDVVGSIPTQTFVEIDRSLELRSGKECTESNHYSRQDLVNNEQSDPLMEKELTHAANNGDGKMNGNGHAKHVEEEEVAIVKPKEPVATVAWMIIFGDAFHNFIDGLSIGAAFSDSILLGVSICIAVLCEELPHELGDFAILLNAGLSKKKALLFNFLSACTCYLGLVIGITLSEVAHATPWILGVAGGMFLYISLADMMPEMNRAAEEHKDKPFTVFFIQNLGFICGFGVILLVSHFGGQINIG